MLSKLNNSIFYVICETVTTLCWSGVRWQGLAPIHPAHPLLPRPPEVHAQRLHQLLRVFQRLNGRVDGQKSLAADGPPQRVFPCPPRQVQGGQGRCCHNRAQPLVPGDECRAQGSGRQLASAQALAGKPSAWLSSWFIYSIENNMYLGKAIVILP